MRANTSLIRLAGAALAVALVAPLPALAQEEEPTPEEVAEEPRPAETEPAEEEAPEASLEIGGALRFNYFVKSWEGQEANRSKGGDFALDTFRLNFDATYDMLVLSAEYRFYQGYHMLHHGYMGLQLDEVSELDFGVTQAPFGILPYASHNWFFTLAYYVGLEDDYDLGVKYARSFGPLDLQVAFYKNDEGHYTGSSSSSARYSYDVVPATTDELGYAGLTEDRSNSETNQGNVRLAYTFDHGDLGSTEVGLSGRVGQLYNATTTEYGSHWAGAAHLNGTYGRFNLMASAVRYEFNPANPDGVSDDIVVMGAYDFPYKVASKGTVLLAGLAYELPVDLGPLDSLTFYDDVNVLLKDQEGFEDSWENVVGFVFAAGPIWSYVDFAMGKNHPWLGPNYGSSLAEGDPDADWENRFNVNLAWYF